MGRRRIINDDEQHESFGEAGSNNAETTDELERLQTTLQLSSDLADDLGTWADTHGMSRNAAITYFIAEGLSAN